MPHGLPKRGVSGLYLCGTTGEGLLQTVDERKKILETVAKSLDREISLMVHVGTMATRDACDLALHARNNGGDAISSLPVQYYAVSFDFDIEHLSEISEVGGLPFYPYLFPKVAASMPIKDLIDGFFADPEYRRD